MPEPRSPVRTFASGVGDTFGLFVNWASMTGPGRLNVTGLLAALGAAVAWWADLVPADAERAVARHRLLLGTLAIPFYGMGYWHVAQALRKSAPRAAAVVRVSGVYAAAVGTAVHAVAATAIVASSPGPELVAFEALEGPPLLLWWAAFGAVVIASLAFVWSVVAAPTPYPIPLAVANPVVLVAAALVAGRLVPGWREHAAFVAPHVGHLVFFLLSSGWLMWRHPARWH